MTYNILLDNIIIWHITHLFAISFLALGVSFTMPETWSLLLPLLCIEQTLNKYFLDGLFHEFDHLKAEVGCPDKQAMSIENILICNGDEKTETQKPAWVIHPDSNNRMPYLLALLKPILSYILGFIVSISSLPPNPQQGFMSPSLTLIS